MGSTNITHNKVKVGFNIIWIWT